MKNTGPRYGSFDVQAAVSVPDAFANLINTAMNDAAALFPNSLHALHELAMVGRDQWRAVVSGEKQVQGRTINRRSGRLADSINVTVDENPPDGELIRYVIAPDNAEAMQVAYWLEVGTDAFDMKKVLQTSHKVREGKDGKKYLIIPFRWGTPSTTVVGAYVGREIPRPVYSFMLRRSPDGDRLFRESSVTGTFTEPSVLDGITPVTRRTYSWGDSLTPQDIRELGLDPDSKPGRHMVGMYRFNDPEDPANKHAQHITFRVMSENSKPGSWVRPAMPGYHVAENIKRMLDAIAPSYLQTALDIDMDELRRRAAEEAARGGT